MINRFKPICINRETDACPQVLKHTFHTPNFQLTILLAETFMLGMIFAKFIG